MKESTKKLINEQIKKVLAELEQIEDVADRVELRIEAIQTIYNISCHDLEDIMLQGKESIKEDKVKEPIVEEEEEEQEVVIDEPEEEVMEEPEEVTIDEVIEAGEKLNPDVAAEQAMQLEQEEVVEESDEKVIVQETDVTDAFVILNPEISRDFREELALQIVEYGTLETYKTLNFIQETDDTVIANKNLLAYWIDTMDLETIEYYINYFASNIEQDENGEEVYVDEELHIDFLNENNISGFIDYVNSICEE